MMDMQAMSLVELNGLVKKSLRQCMPDKYWVQAELSDVREHYSGHCYLEFVQKDERTNNLIAKARGTIWANVYRMLKPYFEQETGQTFTSGIKVLVQVGVEFHELYGYSLTVTDIDPTYTVGDLARRRREILKRLEEEGVLHLNKELEMPILPQRIAVISSATAAGYGDFCNQLKNNPYGFIFYPKLFPALMQGDRVESSIISALDRINAEGDRWEVVVIIRGGGATSDLSGFDTYDLAANCAQFPLPIITGIGHERDDTVIDSVSHTRVKTPTAAAEYLINRTHETALQLENLSDRMVDAVASRMEKEKNRLKSLTEQLPLLTRLCLKEEHYRQERLAQSLQMGVRRMLTEEQHKLQLLAQQVEAASPERLLKRGYSITLHQGKAVTCLSDLKKGDEVITRYAQGQTTSVITEIKKK